MPELVGLVPAAGYATRLQPLDTSKETLTVCGRPLMCHLIDRMRIAGCSRIRVTTRAEKGDVVGLAHREGADVVLAEPNTVSESLLAALAGVPDDAVVLVGFPDTVWHPADAFVRLTEAVSEDEPVVLGLFEVVSPGECDVVEVAPSGRIGRISVRPERAATNLTWGILAARGASLRGLEGWDEPGLYLDSLARSGVLRGVRFDGPYTDGGTAAGLARLRADPDYDPQREV